MGIKITSQQCIFEHQYKMWTSVKCLLYKCEDESLIPSTLVKARCGIHLAISALGADTEESLGFPS